MSEPTKNETDLDLERIASEEDDLDIDNAPYKIRTQGADLTLELLSQKYTTGEIIIPEFQRNYVWPVKKASKLIESFLLGLPVPQIFLYQETKNRDLLVVDGQQRLLSSAFFLRGTLADGETIFCLKGVKPKWEGKSFKDLEEGDKRRLRNYILRATIFEQIDPADDKSVYEIFERLNTGGIPLTEQEVRNCINRGPINLFLEELNLHESWRSLLGKTSPDKRMKDIEIVLRVLALVEGWKVYRKPMKDFISVYMARYVNISKDDQDHLRTLFKSITDFIYKKVGVDAFRMPGGRVNVAVLDSVMTAIALTDIERINDFEGKLYNIKRNESYLGYVSKSTTDDDSVKGRIKMMLKAIS